MVIQDFLNHKVGHCNIPLAYVNTVEVMLPPIAPPLALGQPHSTEHGSVEVELIVRALHMPYSEMIIPNCTTG